MNKCALVESWGIFFLEKIKNLKLTDNVRKERNFASILN